jgi:protoheme IX farnesyltransferase
VSEWQAILFATLLGVLGIGTLVLFVNLLTALLTFGALIGYGLVYTIWPKRATPQNVVIGGAAGAAPPVLGWTA